MSIINVKCPLCGYIFKTENTTNTVCLKCNKEFLTSKGAKFYNSLINIEREKSIIAKGEAFLKVDSLLDKIDYYLENEQFSLAEELALEALKYTKEDFRVYASLVYAKTNNFKKIEDVSHIPYLKKAIELGTDEEKARLKAQYSNFYKKQKMTSEELENYNLKEAEHLYGNLERLLKNGILNHYKREKCYTPFLISSIFFGFSFLVLITLSIIFSNILLTVTAGGALIAFMAFFFSCVSIKEKVDAFNFALDVFDNYKKFNIPSAHSINILKEFINFALGYLNNNSTISLLPTLSNLLQLIKTHPSKELESFLNNNKLSKKFDK